MSYDNNIGTCTDHSGTLFDDINESCEQTLKDNVELASYNPQASVDSSNICSNEETSLSIEDILPEGVLDDHILTNLLSDISTDEILDETVLTDWLSDVPSFDHCETYSFDGGYNVVQIPVTVGEIACSGFTPSDFKIRRIKRSRRKGNQKGRKDTNSQIDYNGDNSRKPLWKFLLEKLHTDQYNPSVITWINPELKMFKITDSKAITKLWVATRKSMQSTKFEFLARSLRYYYSKGILCKVNGKTNVYQFGDKVTCRIIEKHSL